MKKKFLKVLALLFILLLFWGSVYNIVIAEEQNVVLSIYPRPKIDVILAKSRTKTDVSNFATGLKQALQQKNVDTTDMVVQAIEAQTITDVSTFEWIKKESSTVGTITIQPGGKNVDFVGNQTNPGKNVMYIMPTENQEQKFNFDYTIDFGDSFKAAGMLLRVKQSGSTLTGYMLSFNHPGSNYSYYDYYMDSGNLNGGLWKFTFDGNNNTNMQKELIKGLNINTSGNLSISATDMEITISGQAIDTSYTYTIPDDYASNTGNGYGFFSDHYSHSCAEWGKFSLQNINLQTAVVKSFNEVLRVPEWRKDAYKIFVYIEDGENEEIKSKNSMGELITRLLNEDMYFVGWGSSKNQTQIQDLIKSNNDKGKFINNTGYTTSLNDTAQYIKELIDSIKSSTYLLVDEPISIEVNPKGIDEHTIDETWQYGKWKVTHDHTYFENDMGQFANSGKYTDGMIKSFDKTGKYVITYEDRAITPSEIYVHRRPVAVIDMQISGTNVTLTSNSYDLDKKSTNNGIEEVEWKYKAMDETDWHTEELKTIDTSKSYIVQLRAKDYQGEWSAPTTRFITKDPEVLPIAMFSLGAEKISKYEKLEITDSSYDPSGGTISKYNWELYKDKSKIEIGSESSKQTPSIDFTNKALGEYTLYLTVTNNKSKTSKRFGRTFTVTKDEIAPEFIATPTEQQEWKQSVSVQLKFTDRGGSLFRGYKYAITNNQEMPTSWSEEKKISEDNIEITEEGEKYLYIKGYDNDNNESIDKVLGPYKIDKTGPTLEIKTEENNGKLEAVIKDFEAGIEKYKIDISGSNAEGNVNFSSNWITKYKGQQQVTHYWKDLWIKDATITLTAFDIAGNEKVSTAKFSHIDDTKPTAKLKGEPTYIGNTTCAACGKSAYKISWTAEFSDTGSGAVYYLENASAQIDGAEGTKNVGHLVMEKPVPQGSLFGVYEESFYIHSEHINKFKAGELSRTWLDQYLNESNEVKINWNIK